ncbi:UNVERIFIED_CONTAM: hypothetical protein FKN15_023444 [Acipenser sinensis]
MLCLYDLGISRVVKAVVLPGRVTAIEPLINHGGASASTQHLHQSLRWFFGAAAVVTDVGHVLLIDLCLDDLSCSQSELEASDLEVVNKSPAEIPRIRETVTREGRHLCLQLQSPSGTTATAVQYLTRTNQLAVGFSDGYLQLWNMKTLQKEYHSQLEGGRVPVHALTFQEPENDPRNCCYLWAVQSAQDSEGDVVSLHLLQLAFGDRKSLASGQILYEGLEYCEERYSQDLTGGVFSLRAQATNTRLLGCQTIEKFRTHPDRDESMNEVSSPDTSVAIFSWQVKSYGQGKPSTYLGVFDINRWYHAQMPDSLRTGEFLHNCSYFALWSLDAVTVTSPNPLLDILTLSFLKKSGPCLSEVIPDGYSRCLMAGLLSPRLVDVQPSSLTEEEQLEAILSTVVETSSLSLITGCIKQWTGEGAPLFDSSCNFIDPQTLQVMQHCQLLLGNLRIIFNCFLSEAQELTEKGLVDLTNKHVVANLIFQYAQMVLWFCRSGLLPEGADLQISKPCYNYPEIQNYYNGRRQKLERSSRGKWSSNCLMIDGMVSQFGDQLEKVWKRDEGGTGRYPPPTLHYLFVTQTALDLILHPATSRSMQSWQHARIIQALMCQGEHRQALRYIQMMKPSMSTSSEIKLYLTVLLFNRCMVEAWGLLRQHSNRLNVEELLKHMYEMCREMGQMEDLLKLPFTVTEQNDRDPQLKERTIARNSILDQYGKVLPRVQRRLATERAKPYHHPSTILREVSRPKPLSTMAKPAASGNILTRATFINNVLSKIGEVWVGENTKPALSPFKSPKIPELPLVKSPPPSLDQTDAFVGTPITKTTKRISRLLDLVVLPTLDAVSIQQTPPKVIPSWTTSSPLRPSAVKPSYLKNVFKPSELTLLQTPPVVKKARALTSVASSFPGFTPQSILRSSQRPTPVGSPSASPGRSLTPPLRLKESRITFIEEATTKTAQWSNGVAADNQVNLLSVLKSRSQSASPWSTSAEERVSFAPSKPLVLQKQDEDEGMAEKIPDRDASEDMEFVKEMSHISARSGDSTLEFHDAPTPEEFEDDVVITNAKPAVSVDCKPAQVEEPQVVVLEEEEVYEVDLEKQEERLPSEDANEVVEPLMGYKAVVHASEEVASSENKPEDIAESGKIEEHVCLEEETPAEESGVCLEKPTVAGLPVISEVVDHSVVEDPELVSYTELQPTVPVLFPVQFSNMQHLEGELLEIRETSESEVPKIHDDQESAPSGFSLILEAEDGENEIENSSTEPTAHHLIVGLPKTRESEDHAEEGHNVSKESEEQTGNPEAVALVKAAEKSPEIQIDIAESLPYVPEPIKMSIAENLLDVVKDTSTKEFVTELVDGCMQEEMLVTGKTLRSSTSKPLKEPFHVLTEASVKEPPAPATPKRGARKTKEVTSESVKQILQPIDGEPLDQPDLQVPTTPRRATRSAKHQPQTNMSDTPRRTLRKTKDVKLETDADQHQTTQPTTPWRGGRRTRSSVVEPLESIKATDKASEQEVAMTATPTRRTRKKSNILAVSESAQVDQPVKVPASPSKSTRKSRGVTLEIPQVAQQKEISTEHHYQMPLTPKRGRKSKSSLEQLKTATPRRVTRSRLSSLTEVPENALSILENACGNKLQLQAPDASKKSTSRVETTETSKSGIMMVEGIVSHQSHHEVIKEVHGTGAKSSRRRTTKTAADQALETQYPSPDEAEETRGLAELCSSDELHAEDQNIKTSIWDSEKMDPEKATPKKARKGRPSKVPDLPVPDLPAPEPFVFAPPRTRSMKGKESMFRYRNK